MARVADFIDGAAYVACALTILAYLAAVWLQGRVKHPVARALLSPLTVAMVFVVAGVVLTGADPVAYEASTQPIVWLLTPATVCLALPLYRHIDRLRRYPVAIVAGAAAGALVSLCVVAVTAWLFRLSHVHYVSLLPKSITTAIGVAVSGELGGIVSLTAVSISLTGIAGNIMAGPACRLLRLDEPVARGVALGSAAHVIGTVRALEMGEVEGAMGSLAIVISGIVTVVAAPLLAHLL
ncbi:MAG: LrgB family protein [Actinomycetes bacterium]|jgi:putative effector of murein hydrolase|nr:LrgB family protein [Actinomycetes bacterium]